MTFAIGKGEFPRMLLGLFVAYKNLLAVFKKLLVGNFLTFG